MGLKFNPFIGQFDVVSSGGGGGGVNLPGSSTDNALVRWDGTGGDTLQNSGVTLDDSNAILLPCATNDSPNAFQFQTAGQGIGYNTSAARINLIMSSSPKVLVGNSFIRTDETLLINDSAQSSTFPGIASPFATTTGISVTSGNNLYLIGGGVNAAHITSTLFTMNLPAVFPSLTNATRGAAGTAGKVIFNTDDGNLNIDDGTNWILPDGTVT